MPIHIIVYKNCEISWAFWYRNKDYLSEIIFELEYLFIWTTSIIGIIFYLLYSVPVILLVHVNIINSELWNNESSLFSKEVEQLNHSHIKRIILKDVKLLLLWSIVIYPNIDIMTYYFM